MNYYINQLIGKGNGPKIKHDQIFKYFLGQEEVALAFLKLVLTHEEQQDFALEQTHSEKDSFENQRADSVFSVPLRVKIGDLSKVYFLIEHKSYYDEGAIGQLLGYRYQLIKKLSRGGTRSSRSCRCCFNTEVAKLLPNGRSCCGKAILLLLAM